MDGTSRDVGLGTFMVAVVARAAGASDGVVHAATYSLIAVQGAGAPSRSIMAEAVGVSGPVRQRRDVVSSASGRVIAVRTVRQALACVAAGGEVAPVGALTACVIPSGSVAETNTRVNGLVGAASAMS